MANTHTNLTSLFSDIADAIRAKTGETGTIVADNFPSAISGIETGLNFACYKQIVAMGYYSTRVDYTKETWGGSIPIPVDTTEFADFVANHDIKYTIITMILSSDSQIFWQLWQQSGEDEYWNFSARVKTTTGSCVIVEPTKDTRNLAGVSTQDKTQCFVDTGYSIPVSFQAYFTPDDPNMQTLKLNASSSESARVTFTFTFAY